MDERTTFAPTTIELDEELPLHPQVVRWLRAYAAAGSSERDGVVAGILADLNAALWRTRSPGRVEGESAAPLLTGASTRPAGP